MTENEKPDLTTRQRVALRLILMAVEIVQPWRYSHEADKLIDEIKAELG